MNYFWKKCFMAVLAGLVGCWLGSGNSWGAESSGAKIYQLQAAFLYNFTKFVEWLPASFDGPDAPLIVAIAGKDPSGLELEHVVKDRTINGRKIVVRMVETPGATQGAHVLFLPASVDPRLEEWLNVVRGKGVLTVGESERFAKAGGMIRFVLEGDKVRFEIRLDSAEEAGLKISAQLLKLAKTVRRKP